MSDIENNNIGSVIYRSNDPINNFAIRVKLERLTSNSLIPSLPRFQVEQNLDRLLLKNKRFYNNNRNDVDRSQYEEVVIHWQEKLFNYFEFEEYGRDLGTQSTPIERKYFQEINKMKNRRIEPGRIFTYVESDLNNSQINLEYFMTDSPNEEPSHLALGMKTIRKRRSGHKNFQQRNYENLSKTNLINEKPTDNDLQIAHLSCLSYQTMFIMVDLSDNIRTATSHLAGRRQPLDEHVLCRIRVYSNGVIVMEPDFNNDKLAYIVETRNFHNEVYQYYLEHASTPISSNDLIKERTLFNEISLRQQKRLEQTIGNQFDTPSRNIFKLFVFGEIVSATNFDYDHLYVYYCLDFDDDWYVERSKNLSGFTTTGTSQYDDIVYYSHPFEFELCYNRSIYKSALKGISQMPRILFQVASYDTWNRHRNEGYTYINIPNAPGFYDQHLSCWRARGYSIFDEVRRFFIGGSTELDDITYVAVPKLFDKEKNNLPFSRFGFRTVSTGTINIRFNVVCQSEAIAIENRKQHRTKNFYRYDNEYISNADQILFDFERAKQRARDVRERFSEKL